MDDKILVSVIMPVYNAKDYVGRAIESILSQDFDAFELIIIDDGSTDGSGLICDDFAKKDSRVILIHQKNSGTSAARNVGLAMARGKYITFCDHDDEYLPHLIRDNFELIEKENADVLQFSINQIYTEKNGFVEELRLVNGSVLAENLPYKYLDVRLNDNFVIVWNHFYKRDVVADLKFNEIFDHGMEDCCFNLAVMYRVKQKYVFNSGVYYNHYMYSNSSGAVSKSPATKELVAQLKVYFDMEYDCLKNFFIPRDGNECRAVEVLMDYLGYLKYRVNLVSKSDFDKFRKMNLFCNFPFRLKISGRLYLWSFNNCCWIFKMMWKMRFGCETEFTEFKKTALYGFFENLYRSKRGRWLFDLCNAAVKIITLPFRLFE